MDDRLLTVDEVAQRLGVGAETVRRWLRAGTLRGAHLPNKAGWRVRESDLDAFIDAHMNVGGACEAGDRTRGT